MTKGYAVDIFLIGLIAIPLAIAGMILLVVGLVPVIMWVRCDLGWMIRLWIDNQFFLVG